MTTPMEKPTNLLAKVLITAAAILVLVVGGLTLVKSQTAKAPAESAQKSKAGGLPDFTLTQFQGKSLKFSELGSKVVLLNFWATWCEACIMEMPSIVQVHKAYRDKGFEVVAINVDDKPEAVLPKAMKDLQIDFKIYTDPDQKLAELFDVHAIPLTLIIDRDRKILFSHNGEYNWDSPDFHQRLEGWLTK